MHSRLGAFACTLEPICRRRASLCGTPPAAQHQKNATPSSDTAHRSKAPSSPTEAEMHSCSGMPSGSATRPTAAAGEDDLDTAALVAAAMSQTATARSPAAADTAHSPVGLNARQRAPAPALECPASLRTRRRDAVSQTAIAPPALATSRVKPSAEERTAVGVRKPRGPPKRQSSATAQKSKNRHQFVRGV